jgi:hypothetical protein
MSIEQTSIDIARHVVNGATLTQKEEAQLLAPLAKINQILS